MKFLLISTSISVGVILTVIADMILKKGGLTDWRYLVGGFLIYGSIALPVSIAFKYSDFGQLFLVWEAVAIIVGICVASWFYGETFTSYRAIALLLSLGALWFAYK
ncbi:MAG: hypothetical protein WC802_04100 [Patescibacteria group bacterium]|jgi:multidrug transporter EmrE-like cation transporter